MDEFLETGDSRYDPTYFPIETKDNPLNIFRRRGV
jgi:hypothetical protein